MQNIVITGYAGTGKSTVGKVVAHILGWEFIDTDQHIVEREGKPISVIFNDHGEEYFRTKERESVQIACEGKNRVVAVGGGAITIQENLKVIGATGLIVSLDAKPETIRDRLEKQEEIYGEEAVRPLLKSEDPLKSIRSQKAERQPAYATADWTVHTDRLSVQEVAEEVVRIWTRFSGKVLNASDSIKKSPEFVSVVNSKNGECPLLVGWSLLGQLGELLNDIGRPNPAYVISDNTVAGFYGDGLLKALELSGIEAKLFCFEAGEANKTLDTAGRIYDWLAVNRAKRDETIIALGGGVVGDLAGFVASTYNRGMNFVQAPTSVAAMMDASIGGKTAVDLKQGKNLVGAFHQPLMVIADVSTLVTLPRREAVEGWAEGIKHGLILDPGLFEIFESEKESLLELDHVVTTDVIKRSMGIKARIVSLDERETLGYRTLLNYGHTLGHALETATEYGVLLHGEAVAIGMMAAAKIGNRLGITPDTLVERQERVLRSFDLPISIPKVDMEMVNDAMALDKKAEGSRLRWVLLKDLGQAVVRDDVPDTLIRDVLSSMLR